MMISTGKNNFINNTFDKYRWSANTYETQEEILTYLQQLGVCKKRIRGISAIGSLCYGLGPRKEIAAKRLWEAGIITDYDFYHGTISFRDGTEKRVTECTALFNHVKMERKAVLYEPLQIHFEDGNTLELLPWAGVGLRIGYNSLPKDMTDGTNHCEYDIGVLFDPILGNQYFSDIEVISNTEKTAYCEGRSPKVMQRNTYCFDFSCGELLIEELQCNAYELSFPQAGKITCGELTGIKPSVYQSSFIQEGYYHRGQICIFPAKGLGYDEAPYHTDHPDVFAAHYSVPSLFYPILQKYFDHTLLVNKKYSHGYFDDNDWNYYTKENVLTMIGQARQKLDGVRALPEKERFDQLHRRRGGETEEELHRKTEEELDYTDRFLNRLLGMTLNSPEHDYIVFLGP